MAFGFGFGLTRGGSTGGPFATAALDLNFLGGTLDSKVTFTRTGSVATYVNSSGYITTAGANTARFDYDPVTLASRGLLIEQSATNLVLYSDQFSNAQWSKAVATVSADQITSPDGTVNADKVVVNNGASSGTTYQTITKAASAIQYTASVYAKQGEWNSLGLYLQGGSFTNRASVIVNLATGVITTAASAAGTFTSASATITSAGSGWYRVTLTATSGTELSIQPYIYPGNNGTFPNGDGTSGIYVWGAQLETGSFATSYIPTTTATVTRGTDVAAMTGTNFSSWFNGTTGTFYAEGAPITSTPTPYSFLAEGYTGSLAGTFTIGTGGTTSQFGLDVRNATALNANEAIATTFTVGGVKRAAVAYDGTPSAALVLDGSVITATANAPASTATSLYIGCRGGSTNVWNGWVRRISFFNSKLTNAQMQTLTT